MPNVDISMVSAKKKKKKKQGVWCRLPKKKDMFCRVSVIFCHDMSFSLAEVAAYLNKRLSLEVMFMRRSVKNDMFACFMAQNS